MEVHIDRIHSPLRLTGPRDTPVYKDLLQNVDHLQQTFHDVNALLQPDFAPLEVTGLNRADSFKGGRPLRVLALGVCWSFQS
jgi:hypothetical protein